MCASRTCSTRPSSRRRCSKATLKSVDESKLAGIKGIRKVVKFKDAVAVVADGWWQANKAAEALADNMG